MSNLDSLRDTIINQRCYQNANPTIKCNNAGIVNVTIVSRDRIEGRLRQITEKGWSCKTHAS